MRMAARLSAMGQEKYIGTTRKSGGRAKWTGKISLDEASLELPQKWKRGRLIFVNSMADLFHDKVPAAFVRKVFDAMAAAPQHTFQVLTKRPERMLALSDKLPWATHIWMGVSVESADYTGRIDLLRQSGAAVKFLSLEPLLGPLDDLDLRGIDWVIAGGESGPGARPMEQQWVRSIRDQCRAAEVAFHFKQWGGTNKKRAGRNLDGRTWDDLPGFRANALPHVAAAE
jgi:protein gp37